MAKGSGTTRSVGGGSASTTRTGGVLPSSPVARALRGQTTYSASSARTTNQGGSTPKVSLSQISVSDSSYRMALGRSPRGRGNWAFSIGSREAFNDVTKAFWHNGSYTQAVQAAKKEAQKRGKTIIYVMS